LLHHLEDMTSLNIYVTFLATVAFFSHASLAEGATAFCSANPGVPVCASGDSDGKCVAAGAMAHDQQFKQ
jgi:hypothetical protein